MHINEGKDKLAIFYTAHNVSILFPSSIFSFSLLYNFIIFPPQCFHSLLHNFLLFFSSTFFISVHHNFNIFPQFHYFPSSMLLFPPLEFYYFPSSSSPSSSSSLLLFSLLHLLILIVFPFPPHFDCFDRVDVGSTWGRCGVDVGSKIGRASCRERV